MCHIEKRTLDGDIRWNQMSMCKILGISRKCVKEWSKIGSTYRLQIIFKNNFSEWHFSINSNLFLLIYLYEWLIPRLKQAKYRPNPFFYLHLVAGWIKIQLNWYWLHELVLNQIKWQTKCVVFYRNVVCLLKELSYTIKCLSKSNGPNCNSK